MRIKPSQKTFQKQTMFCLGMMLHFHAKWTETSKIVSLISIKNYAAAFNFAASEAGATPPVVGLKKLVINSKHMNLKRGKINDSFQEALTGQP